MYRQIDLSSNMPGFLGNVKYLSGSGIVVTDLLQSVMM